MQRESFIFYKSWLEGLEGFTEQEQGAACLAILRYCAYGEEPQDVSPVVNMAFKYTKPQIDVNNVRYENGCKGGAPVGNQNAKKNNQTTTKKQPKNNQTTTKKQPNVYVYDNDNVNENDNVYDDVYANGNERPTVQQIAAYMSEYAASKNHALDITLPDKFYNYYKSKNWHYKNKQPLKDWKAAVRNWVLKDIKESQSFLNERKERWIQDESDLGYFNKWILNAAPYVSGHLDEPEGANGAMNPAQLSTLMKGYDSPTIKSAVTAIEGNRELRKNIGSLFATLTNYLNQ